LTSHYDDPVTTSSFSPYSVPHSPLHSFPTRRSSDLNVVKNGFPRYVSTYSSSSIVSSDSERGVLFFPCNAFAQFKKIFRESAKRSEEHTSELQSRFDLVCRLLLEKKKEKK